MSYPSLHEIKAAADDYWRVWEQLLEAAPALRKAIGQHSPSALGWKVDGDVAPLEAAERLYELGDSIYMGPVSHERAILTIRKPQAVALDTLQDIKVLQRRPSRPEDALGADSLDMVLPHGIPETASVEAAVAELDVACKAERNEAHEWLSLIYSGHEFKLQAHPVWEVCVREAERLIS
jgi:hypothetical protein